MGINYIKIDWDFEPLIDMNLSRFTELVTPVPREDVNPLFFEILSAAKLKFVASRVFYSPPGYSGPTHSDDATQSSICKINWATAPAALNEWYEILPRYRSKTPIITTLAGSTFTDYSLAPQKVIESAHLSGWYMIEAAVPHKITNQSAVCRWGMSLIICPEEQSPPGWATTDIIRNRLKNLIARRVAIL